ncbi:MAG: sulfotransferase domain-containing protein [Nitrospinales bacterium]
MDKSFPPIQTPCIFVTSGGRTATRFLSEVLAVSVKDCFSVQEPDVWRLDSLIDLKENKGIWFQKIRDFGLFNMTFGKFSSLGNVRGLSLARQRNRIDETFAAVKLYRIRNRFISRQKKRVYAECNLQLAGLIDVIPKVFPNSKTIFIIRDGRDWVASWMNSHFTLYAKKDPLQYLGSARPNARMFPDDPFHHRWQRFSPFQRICWLWRFHIEYALKTLEKNVHAKPIKYEDLFKNPHPQESIMETLKYLTNFPDGYQAEYRYNGELSGKKFHESRRNQFPKWGNWSLALVREFQEICGDFLIQQGYGKEHQWQEMVANVKSAEVIV